MVSAPPCWSDDVLSNVLLLEDFVILDSQVVYDSVTFLIIRSMSFDNVGKACSKEFRETGQSVCVRRHGSCYGSSLRRRTHSS